MSISTPKSARHFRIAPPSDPNVRLRILLRVADDDVAAAPAHQLVESEVVEVPAVGEVDEPAARRRLAEQLGEQVPQRERRSRTPARILPARIAQPPAEPRVEHRQQERHRSRRVSSRCWGSPRRRKSPSPSPAPGRPGSRSLSFESDSRVGRDSLRAADGVLVFSRLRRREPAKLRREDERRRLAFLLGQLRPGIQVQRGVHDRRTGP